MLQTFCRLGVIVATGLALVLIFSNGAKIPSTQAAQIPVENTVLAIDKAH